MGSQSLTLYFTILSLISSSPVVFSQQAYMGNNRACSITDKTTTVFGYICNNQHPSCQTYLIFRSKPPYDSAWSISNLLSSDPFQISELNSLGNNYNETIQTNREVIVPVRCSCSGEYYQSNSSYIVVHGNTQYIIATSIYQSLTTCHALLQQRTNVSRMLFTGMRLTVPLRCACPTGNQISNGVKILLTYPVLMPTDSISSISNKFGVDIRSILDANELPEVNSTLYNETTLLIPLRNRLSINQTIIPPPPQRNPTRRWAYTLIGISVGAFVSIISALVFWYLCKRRVRKFSPEMKFKPRLNSKVAEEIRQVISDISNVLKVYTFDELEVATDGFCSECRIEGSVYRGFLDENAVAIKKMNGDISKEISVLKNVNHFNLIRLLGACFSEGQWYLVYEYAENGSLSEWLCNGGGSKFLSWVQRVNIALDVATGLHYLHSYTEPAYVHKDMRSSNVLLDNDFRAKIANFSMARVMKDREGGFATGNVVGTKGYMAPEYLETGLVSPRLDVYAFGIVMLEIITGKEAATSVEGGNMFLGEALLAVLREQNAKEKLQDLMDPSLHGNYPLDMALIMARLIEGCLSRNASSRPSMDGIVQSLSKILATSLTWALTSAALEFQSNGNCDGQPIRDKIEVLTEG